jgi:hypothetical protein
MDNVQRDIVAKSIFASLEEVAAKEDDDDFWDGFSLVIDSDGKFAELVAFYKENEKYIEEAYTFFKNYQGSMYSAGILAAELKIYLNDCGLYDDIVDVYVSQCVYDGHVNVSWM